MSYEWCPGNLGPHGLNNPLKDSAKALEVCQHDVRFEFYLKWNDGRKVRYSRVNGWEIKTVSFESLDEATSCITYIIRRFREVFSHPEPFIEKMKRVPIRFYGQKIIGEPIAYSYDGKPCQWKEAPASSPKRGRVSDEDLGR